MSKQVKGSILAIGGALLLAVFLIWLRPNPEERELIEQAPLVETIALTASSGTIPVIASGTVQPREEIQIAAQVSGRIVYVNPAFREGGLVSANSALLKIDDSDFVNQVRIARADVAAQEVAVLQAREEFEIAQDELSRFNRREANGGAAALIDRNDYASRFLPPENLASASSEPDAALGEPNVVTTGLATREPQLRSAEAAKARASANLAVAELALSRTVIRAPFRALVQDEAASVGALVQAGQSLGSIAATSSLEVRLSLTPDEAALIPGLLTASRSNIPADVFYEYGGITYRWTAFVERADATLDSGTRNVEIFLRVPFPASGGRPADEGAAENSTRAPPLLIGAFVNAEINGSFAGSYAEIPATALRPGNEIWVVREGKLAILPVRVIQRRDEIAYVATPSLAEGGRLVTSSLTAPANGMQVRVTSRQSE